MMVLVYRSSKKDGLYVYVLEESMLERLPDPLLKQLGSPEQALTFDLETRKTLGSENPDEVRANLNERGYHVQMPRSVEAILAEIADQQSP